MGLDIVELNSKLDDIPGVIKADIIGFPNVEISLYLDEDIVLLNGGYPTFYDNIREVLGEMLRDKIKLEILAYRNVRVEDILKRELEQVEGVIGVRTSFEYVDEDNGLDTYNVWIGAEKDVVNLVGLKNMVHNLCASMTPKINTKVAMKLYK